MASIRAFVKVLIFLLACVLVMPVQFFVLLFTTGRGAYVIPRLWHKAMIANLQIKCRVIGTPNITTAKQTLYMGNHLSYLDIPALTTIIPYSFVAKSEVQTWPLFGALSRLQRTAFIVRKRSQIAKEKDAIAARLAAGESLIIFPEGTSTSGMEVLPFKSSLFTLALGENAGDIEIQPFTIRLAEVDGKPPATKDDHDIYAWPREMELEIHQHLWRFAKSKGAVLEITFHEPLKASEFTDRKVLALTCQREVSKPLEQRYLAHNAA